MRKISTKGALTIVLIVGIASASAMAHIPHVSWLMGRMEHKKETMAIRSYSIEMTCGLPGQEQHKEKLLLKKPRMVRRELAQGSTIICNKNKCVQKTEGKKVQVLPSWVFLQYLFFVERSVSADRWVRLLKSLKIDTKVDTLTRAGSRLAVVLGAKEWERDRPQFWLDKDRYLPLRLMIKDKNDLVDIQWINWGSRTTGDWFPQSMQVRTDGKIIDSCTVDHVDVNVHMSADLFQIK